MGLKVCKFGGTSMADAKTIRLIANIVKSDNERRFVVVSAPGKRVISDPKITDTLYKCYDEKQEKGNCRNSFSIIRKRFTEIVQDLKISLDIKSLLDEIEKGIIESDRPDFAASSGEFLAAKILAEVLDFEFIDAKELIKFDAKERYDIEYTNDVIKRRLCDVENAVIPGFYGALSDGTIKTFSRGGSDITGAIIARAVGADVYENWTDVNGFMTTDPRIVTNPKPIDIISFRELRELSYMGANVLHPEAIFPVALCGIPINIKNTFNPDNPGTMIVSNVKIDPDDIVTGIAGKKGFTVVHIEKAMMNNEVGFARKVLSVLEHYDVPFEHMPSGIDTMSIVIADSEIADKKDLLIHKINEKVCADKIEIDDNMALIATVGHGMSKRMGTASRLFTSLSNAGINVRMIDQGSSELNIIVGVECDDYEKSIKVIYKEFIED